MLVPALLILLVVVYRIILGMIGTPDLPELQWLHNFSPLASVVLCGAVWFPRRLAVAFPFAALLLSDLCLNAHYGVSLLNWSMLPQYLAFALVALLGLALRSRPRVVLLLLGSLASSLLFYVITNTGAWLANPVYAKSGAGWLQALTTGQPGFEPTMLFFRNTAVSDLLFTALFAACMALQPKEERAEAMSATAA